jgi:hypothetical protein
VHVPSHSDEAVIESSKNFHKFSIFMVEVFCNNCIQKNYQLPVITVLMDTTVLAPSAMVEEPLAEKSKENQTVCSQSGRE